MSSFWHDTDLPFVESRRASDSRACYVAHSHPTLSIGVVDRGHSLFSCHGRSQSLGPGTLVSIPPGAVHACNPVAEEAWSYQMLYLQPDWVTGILNELDGHQTALPSQAFVIREPHAYGRFRQLNALLFSAEHSDEKETALIEFIGSRLWQGGTPVPTAHCGGSLPLERVRDYLHDAAGQTVPLAELASLAGLSRYHLIRQFKAATGMTPHAYQLDLRIIQARQRLRQGADLATLAQDLGFADQGHFQRTFKARVAATPGSYRSG